MIILSFKSQFLATIIESNSLTHDKEEEMVHRNPEGFKFSKRELLRYPKFMATFTVIGLADGHECCVAPV